MKLHVIKQQKLWLSLSAIAMAASIIFMGVCYTQFNAPLRPSLDFVGGTKLQLELDCQVPNNCDQPLTTAPIQTILDEQGLSNSSVQVVDKYSLSIRTQDLNVEQRTKLLEVLNSKIGKFDTEKTQIDTVGPTAGKELFIAGIISLLVSFFGITVYLSFRFQFDYAVFAILALIHDVLITCGLFAILGLVAGVEVDSLFLVALLTIIGFSVNDTVIIYDRIRENLERHPEESINDIVDRSVNETLTRSINTTLTTLFPLGSIFLFGGATLKYFALALIVGFVSGAYSSIFIASILLAWWRRLQGKERLAITDQTSSEEA